MFIGLRSKSKGRVQASETQAETFDLTKTQDDRAHEENYEDPVEEPAPQQTPIPLTGKKKFRHKDPVANPVETMQAQEQIPSSKDQDPVNCVTAAGTKRQPTPQPKLCNSQLKIHSPTTRLLL